MSVIESILKPGERLSKGGGMAKAKNQSIPSPPASLEAEQATLGSILLRPQMMDEVADLLTAGDFHREARARIFRAILELYLRNEPVDYRTVAELLKERGQLEEVGGPVFLVGLNEQVGGAANAGYYARLVWEKAQVRKLQAKAAEILNESPNGNLEEYLTWAESQILEITQPAIERSRADSFPPLNNTLVPLSERLKAPPPPREYLFENVLPSGIVGGWWPWGGPARVTSSPGWA